MYIFAAKNAKISFWKNKQGVREPVRKNERIKGGLLDEIFYRHCKHK